MQMQIIICQPGLTTLDLVGYLVLCCLVQTDEHSRTFSFSATQSHQVSHGQVILVPRCISPNPWNEKKWYGMHLSASR